MTDPAPAAERTPEQRECARLTFALADWVLSPPWQHLGPALISRPRPARHRRRP
jgi:hypothetical protein